MQTNSKIRKVLVANRGEIAVRIIRTLRKLGLASVVVYHSADAASLAVREADEAVEVKGSSPVAAYLNIAQIVAACQVTGADAVHPGYGFLSEKAEFADALTAAGVRFIGPSADAIRAMGDKIESKLLARKAGVAVIPGYTAEVRDADHAAQIGADIGYPIMIKASAGGGGKGMRLANSEAECRAGFARATSEARASFGDGRVFIERFIERPRHIEIQILADQHGHVIFLGDRECSIQRRHQKLIEEAPSCFLDEATRTAMGAQAVALARAVNYCSAGTVEFIVDSKQNFYFLEMNTRLQVEHPVTEWVTGLDIVAEQISIAEGAPLAYRQEDIRLQGHAIEVRLCAEDPDNDFMPMTGDVHLLHWPSGVGVRVDHGLIEGQAVSASFDSMLAKIIAHGATRAEAIARLRAALSQTALLGTVTNGAFLQRVLAHPDFTAGDIHTGFLDENRQDLEPAAPDAHERVVLLAAAALTSRQFDTRFASTPPLSLMGGWRN